MAILYTEDEQRMRARKELASLMIALRDESRLSLSEVSRISLVPKSTINNWERALSIPKDPATLYALALLYCHVIEQNRKRNACYALYAVPRPIEPAIIKAELMERYVNAGGKGFLSEEAGKKIVKKLAKWTGRI